MIYRPQFAFPTPPGCIDEDFVYAFDGSNIPQFNQSISGLSLFEVPLPLDQDAAFLWRGFKVLPLFLTLLQGTQSYAWPNITVQFTDPFLNKLSDGLIPATLYGFAQNPFNFFSQLLTGPPVPLEGEIYCPPGGTILVSITAPILSATDTYFPLISLHGVKRYKDCVGRAA